MSQLNIGSTAHLSGREDFYLGDEEQQRYVRFPDSDKGCLKQGIFSDMLAYVPATEHHVLGAASHDPDVGREVEIAFASWC